MATLPSHILKALRDNKTSLGEHPCFPPEEEEKFIIGLLSKTFKEINEKVGIEDYEALKSELSRILTECKKLERNNIQALEELCGRIVNDMFKIPKDSLKIEMHIVDKVDTSAERMFPEKTSDDFSFDDIDDMNYLTEEIYKRRILNALVAGAGMYYMNFIGNYVKEIFEINSDLPSLYKKMIEYNNLLLYCEKDTLNTEKNTDGGKVDVTVSSEYEYPTIKAEGLLFPILVEETVKGILELAISRGLPKKLDKAKYVISKADFKFAEMWDMRLGFALWKLIEEEIESCGFDLMEIGINFFLMEIAEMDCEDFNKSLKEIFARTRRGKKIITDIMEKICYNKDMDDFNDYIQSKNDSTVQINDDDFFEPEELITDDVEYGLYEEVTRKQLRNAANRRMTDPNSVRIERTSNGEIAPVKINKKSHKKSALSRIVIQTFKDGCFEKAQIINGTQDKLIPQYNKFIDNHKANGFIKFKTTEDKIIGKPCVLLIGQNKPVIKCIHIETDDLTTVNSRFDLENVKQIIEKRGINKDFYGLPDTPSENVRVKRERIGVRGNWDWIKNGKPRPWRKEQ